MKKYRAALERFYWAAHSDGELAEFDNNIREHLSSPRWKERREKLIDEVLQKLNLPNKCVQPTIESGRVLPAKKSNRKGSAPAISG